MAIPSEIGLYFNFEVTDDGIPYGCPGLEKFKTENFNTSNQYFDCFPHTMQKSRNMKQGKIGLQFLEM